MKAIDPIKIICFALLTVTSCVFARGGGGGFGGGGHFGGGGFHGGGGVAGFGPHFGGSGFRYSFAGRPMFGRPAMVDDAPRVGRGPNSLWRSQTEAFFNRNRFVASSRGEFDRTSRNMVRARDHVFAEHDGNWHRDWNHRSAHYWGGHWWAWNNGYWIGLDAGFYPWDYYPYYAYDFYPYDYYPGYYADVEPYYSDDGISDYIPAADPTVTAVQNDLAKLRYYRGRVDGLYGKTTRDAVARYQADHHLTVTGTLTAATLRSLGVSRVV